MAYDEQLAARVRVLLKGQRALVEKKMFADSTTCHRGRCLPGS